MIRAGRHIARTRRYIRDYADEIEPDQLVETVRAQARRGDGWVKLVGDWIDRATGDLAPCWPQDVAREAITVAHEEGARVTAHCFGEEVLPQLAAAGIDCIEHATGLRGEVVDTFARQGIAIVPTLVNIATFPQIAEPARAKFPDYHRHMLDLHRRRHETVRLQWALLGSLGALAFFLLLYLYATDPREDLDVLAFPTAVVLRGVVRG